MTSREEAIELLEQKQKQLMTIYQRYLEDGGEPLQEHENWLYALNMAVEKYKQPERPKGRCTYCKDGKTFIGQTIIQGNDRVIHKINFCPNCGNEMER